MADKPKIFQNCSENSPSRFPKGNEWSYSMKLFPWFVALIGYFALHSEAFFAKALSR
jgi:hypothetical protein